MVVNWGKWNLPRPVRSGPEGSESYQQRLRRLLPFAIDRCTRKNRKQTDGGLIDTANHNTMVDQATILDATTDIACLPHLRRLLPYPHWLPATCSQMQSRSAKPTVTSIIPIARHRQIAFLFALSSAWGWLVLFPTTANAQTDPALTIDDGGFQQNAAQVFKTYCLDCHGGAKPAGDFAIDDGLEPNFSNRTVAARWREVINVLNGHEMPPEGEKQPSPEEIDRLVQWATGEMIRVELHERKQHVTLRRLNRNEYRNTIADLLAIDFDTSHFPEDASASGFDNIGQALGSSPLQVELYLAAAESIANRIFVLGQRPEPIHWRFEPETGDSDRNRVRYGDNNAIVNGGRNRLDGNGRLMHHASWDRNINARDFRLPQEGVYMIRVRAASRIPSREDVVAYASEAIAEKRDREIEKNPQRRESIENHLAKELEHFKTSRHYDYGPARLKIVAHLGGQPTTVAEFDVDSLSAGETDSQIHRDRPTVFEFPVKMTTESAGITLHYVYNVPRELENFTIQNKDEFPRPEVWVDWFEIEGPIYPSWPPPSHVRWLPADLPVDKGQQRELAKGILKQFLPRAFRRPASPEELASFLELYDSAYDAHANDFEPQDRFIAALKVPFVAVLVSPHFLFLAEPVDGGDQTNANPAKLNDFEIATRLSYFLWSSMPDDTLFKLAASGKLSDHDVRRQQVDRMLDDPRAWQLTENFAGQWLGIREVGSNPPAHDLFRDYDSHVEASITRQTLAFFSDTLHNDRDILTLIASDHEMLNERLSRYYDLPKVEGDQFRRVKLSPDSNRGGLLTHASILTITSNGTRTSPVKRGTWILKTLLASDPGLPVANVGEIAPKVPGIDKATVRDRLEVHRQLAQCARCHNKIDPLGFALENFDAAGRWRLREGFGYQGRIGDNDPLIDSSAVMPDGTSIQGVAGLRQAILQRKTLFLTSLTEKLFTYALGRELGYADQNLIRQSVTTIDTSPEQRTLRNLIHQVVTSDAFENR